MVVVSESHGCGARKSWSSCQKGTFIISVVLCMISASKLFYDESNLACNTLFFET
jgi:hypothetical protein